MPEPRFKIGDRVVVRSNIPASENPPDFNVLKPATVLEVHEVGLYSETVGGELCVMFKVYGLWREKWFELESGPW